ncbi:SGNH hydrolase-type esterase domain-containing protein [Chaetomium fimeti]|jgi:lysophospholipase L1-like esterase|uniref:SGNH hydrolase-type esterase domain-containing protein n=1 Tax=Chaetomium fimeti TaxID=1854472 RepID=A0AAE0H8Y8_9PEZI|nr:SGNH hydrolase-type esterase domain-containing protein [Chaetomium fimeti]
MKSSFLALLAAPFLAMAAPLESRQGNPPAFFLAGDSTTAVDGGWGDGLVAILRDGAIGQNKGHSGATTASFVAAGDWETVLSLVETNRGKHDCYVTIQFGHNDQKSNSGVGISQFQTNVENMANEVTAAGGTPIILTSLTRRTFSDGTLDDSLADVSEAAKKAAAAVGAAVLDLNAASRKYVQAIGSSDADRYNLEQGDRTHLNDHGAAVFGRMVADLVVSWDSELSAYITADAALSEKIAQGVYA